MAHGLSGGGGGG